MAGLPERRDSSPPTGQGGLGAAGGHSHSGPHSHEHSPHETGGPPTVYDWKVYHPFEGVPARAAVEVSPKRGLIPRWRFVVPHDYQGVKSWGVGAPGGRQVSPEVKRAVHSGPTRLVDGPAVIWFGGHEALSSKLSAYLIFEGEPPHYLAFGQADEPGGPPRRLEGITFAAQGHPPHPHGADPGGGPHQTA